MTRVFAPYAAERFRRRLARPDRARRVELQRAPMFGSVRALAGLFSLLLMAAATPAAGQDKPKPAAASKRVHRAKAGTAAGQPSGAAAKRKSRGARGAPSAADPARDETAAPASSEATAARPDAPHARDARRGSETPSPRRSADAPAAQRGHGANGANAAPDPHDAKAPSSSANALSDVDATENVRREGGTEVKTMDFGGLDIEGQLKTPQMLYFLNRLRAEFDRPELPHRSFIPELQRSTQEDTF